MEQTTTIKVRQVVDWSAAVWAGLISGLLFLLIASILSEIFYDNFLLPVRMIAAVALGGDSILNAPSLITILVGLIIHIPVSLVFAGIIAFVIHRWGMGVGIVGGGLLGLALYFINFYSLTAIFPWFSGLRGGVMIFSHFVFGAAAGGFYELLEIEEFVPVDQN
ncbi:MAG: hypothetical protein QNJ45_17550 [Ardenticatenaceae bacterium]|nr:hypothetical protein [Ardenticatenaceae bacterium]